MKMQINAHKIKQMRAQKCWSQLQLSEMADISLRTLQRVEAKSVASQETIKSIASVLEIDCELLLPESDPLRTDEQASAITTNDAEQGLLLKQERRKFSIHIVIVIGLNLVTFAILFYAYSMQKLDYATFDLLKNIVSGALLIGLGNLTFRAYKKGIIRLKDFS
jgi:transcriptional regulator with XRE-family HTH domain